MFLFINRNDCNKDHHLNNNGYFNIKIDRKTTEKYFKKPYQKGGQKKKQYTLIQLS